MSPTESKYKNLSKSNSVNNPHANRNLVNTNNKSTNSFTLNKLTEQKTRFKALTWNCNGITNKIESFKSLIQKEKPDIAALNEIKCTNEEASGELSIRGFASIFKCRTAKGGGIALLINEKIKYNLITVPADIEEEIIGITIKLSKVKLSIFTIYIPPNKKLNKKCFEFIHKFENYLIMGDLNARLKELNIKANQNGSYLEKILRDLNATVVNNKNFPTNYHNKNGIESSSIIDLIIVSRPLLPLFKNCITLKESAVDVYQRKYFHLPVIIQLLLNENPFTVVPSKSLPYNYKKADWIKFKNNIDTKLVSFSMQANNMDLDKFSAELMAIAK